MLAFNIEALRSSLLQNFSYFLGNSGAVEYWKYKNVFNFIHLVRTPKHFPLDSER